MAAVILLTIAVSVPLVAADRIEIAMGYIPNVQFSPYYVAMEKGYFDDEGLEVTFDYGMSTDIMTLVAGGHVDFGVSDGDQVIIARDRGIPVKVVYTMYVKYPVGIVSFEEKGLTSVRSLTGKKVGTPGPYGSNYIGLQVLLHSAGMSWAWAGQFAAFGVSVTVTSSTHIRPTGALCDDGATIWMTA